jgi:predicted ATP-binding protein involved in virulence
MRLKSVTLKNFRSFEHIKVDLHPRLTVIVGNNGAGKTALLDGIATALTPVLTHLSSANQRLSGRGIKDADFRIEQIAGRGGRSQWAKADYAQVSVETYEGVRWDYWRPSGNVKGAEPAEKWGETQLKEHLAEIYASYKTTQPKLTPVFSYYGASRGSIKVPERLRDAKLNYDHPTAALYDCLDPTSDFREMLEWFDLEESSELRDNKGVVDDDFAPFDTLEAVRAAVVGLLNDYGNPHFNSKHKFMLTRETDGAPMLVEQLSQGYQSMLAMAMDFARRLAIANPHLKFDADGHATNQIFEAYTGLVNWPGAAIEDPLQATLPMSAPAIMLVDEIDLHLHPSWQQRVLQDLMRTFPLTQFIVTTHSPQVLTSADAACIRRLQQAHDADTGKAETQVLTVHQQTRGVTSADVLATIMGVDPIPDVPEARQLAAYQSLIQQNLHDQVDGADLRVALVKHFGHDHPVMRECDRMIRLQAFKLKLPAQAQPKSEGNG